MPFQIEDDLIHWLIGVKCRKITHGYCALKIVTKLHFNSNYNYNAHKTTRTSQAREFKFKSIICVSAHGVSFQHGQIRNCMRHCASQIHTSSTSLFICGSFHIFAICTLSNRKSKKSAISTDPRRLFIDLF